MSDKTVNYDLEIIREFDAPRAIVWKMWTEPSHLRQWWGPANVTIGKCVVEPHAGGRLGLEMRMRDGKSFPVEAVFVEVIPQEKLVVRNAIPDGKGGVLCEFEGTITFVERAGKTTMTFQSKVLRFAPEAVPMLNGRKQGWAQSMARLGSFIDAEANTPNERVIHSSRVLNFPRELVWKAWTQPGHLAKWWGPHGFTNTVLEHEFKLGGVWQLIMHGPDGTDYPNKWIYNEIDEPTRIVLTHENGHRFQVTATFADLDGRRTKLTFRMLFDSAEECDRVKPFAVPGNEGNLDRLSSHLETMS
ncbi:SRPBCC domain-containing protein [Candidatus Sumerlaeota bacterium]|nr:SRPBCC domain-containing protein [Candidatus Sumerlaeota bacterium]